MTDGTRPRPRAAPESWTKTISMAASVSLFAITVAAAICFGGCAFNHGEQLDQRGAEKWIGKPEGELRSALGEPAEAIPFPDTGGKMLIYSAPNAPHYVFETNGSGVIDRAARTK